jgi:transcriptional regulator with XRE-family HTH domain
MRLSGVFGHCSAPGRVEKTDNVFKFITNLFADLLTTGIFSNKMPGMKQERPRNGKRMEKISVFNYLSYRDYLKNWLETAIPRRGQLARLSESANIHKTTLSQILSGAKELSLEQAQRVAQFFSLNFEETGYFILLVNHTRAGSAELREHFQKQLNQMQKNQQQVKSRVSQTRKLNNEERAIYYSTWIYSAVRNLSAIPVFQRPAAIAKRLNLDPAPINLVIQFLLKHGLCVEKNGGIVPGPQMTHLEADSPLVSRRHGNWRIKAMERHPQLDPGNELAYTAPMTLSAADAFRVRSLLLDLIEKTDKIVGPSPSEKLYCMGLDWFEVK